MVSAVFFVVGAAAAVLLAMWVSGHGQNGAARFWAAAMVVAALIYIVFALRAPVGRLLALEAVGVAVYGALAWLGLTRSMWYLAGGWLGHVLWDLLQPSSSRAFVPGWYPALCAGFDCAVAAWLALALWRRNAHAEA